VEVRRSREIGRGSRRRGGWFRGHGLHLFDDLPRLGQARRVRRPAGGSLRGGGSSARRPTGTGAASAAGSGRKLWVVSDRPFGVLSGDFPLFCTIGKRVGAHVSVVPCEIQPLEEDAAGVFDFLLVRLRLQAWATWLTGLLRAMRR
jgi:hypothetical protein